MAGKKAPKHMFSIYLLDKKHKPAKAITNRCPARYKGLSKLPSGSQIYVASRKSDPPWWMGYLGVDVKRSTANSALAFIQEGDRYFALTFGHSRHWLKAACCEEDFGLLVALNGVDPQKLRSCDFLRLDTALRLGAQAPDYADLDFFDLDLEDNQWSSLTGLAKGKYAKLFQRLSGSSSCLHCSSPVTSKGIKELLGALLKCYKSKSHKKTFPNMSKITPVRKSSEREKRLYAKLSAALTDKDERVKLTIPEMIDSIGFASAYLDMGKDIADDEVTIDLYHKHAKQYKQCFDAYGDKGIKELRLVDEEGRIIKSYPLRECFVFETEDGQKTFFLNKGKWYQVDRDFKSKIDSYLTKRFCSKGIPLPKYTFKYEEDYNDYAGKKGHLICLDREILEKESQMEPCDLLSHQGKPVLIHVKNPTSPRDYSHLFNQGYGSAWSILENDEALANINDLIKDKSKSKAKGKFKNIDRKKKFKVVFAIAIDSHRKKEIGTIPFFSRRTLFRILKNFKVLGIDAYFQFIEKDIKSD